MNFTNILHYEIIDKLGAGGMGEVYRARDTKLGREVAIKVLPEAFAHDAERLARFQREAQVLASLNHPNIAAIYGLEESASERYLILELVPGETLAELLARGPIPLEEILGMARQIAKGLETAHERGIIHRDLKPANIKITPEGKVKVLDFGLAKEVTATISSSDASGSPTISVAATRAGVILGTARYMSPEQARGKSLDKRTDIWSFGCVLFEMLTGRMGFAGETVSDTIAAILKTEPDWDALPAGTPKGIERLLRRCLEKSPARRLHDIADARIEIEDALAAPAGAEVQPAAVARVPIPKPRALSPATITLAGVVAVVSLLAGLWFGSRRRAGPSGWTGELLGGSTVAVGPRVSPDGKTIALASASDGRILRRLKGAAGVPVTLLAASPDGKTIYYVSSGDVWAIPSTDGTPRKIHAGNGLAVDPNGREIIVNLNEKEGVRLVRVSLQDGSEKEIPLPENFRPSYLALSGNAMDPSGKLLVGIAPPDSCFFAAAVLDLKSGSATRIPLNYTGDTFYMVWAQDGRVLASGEKLLAHLWRFRPEK
jgi:eukaryotic-like serine/threonine-protein kinase